MEHTKATVKRPHSDFEEILEFCVELCRRMILCGANLERVQTAVSLISNAYHLQDVSIFLMSNYMSMAALDEEGNYVSRQVSIGPTSTHLNRLRSLNNLSYQVVSQKPHPQDLRGMMEQAWDVPSYPDYVKLFARMGSMSCLCLMYGGTWREVIAVIFLTVLMHYLSKLLAKPGLDRIVSSTLVMFFSTLACFGIMASGLTGDAAILIIAISMIVIPGIQTVNAVRNLVCGNEMNGSLQLLKVTIETMFMALGVYAAISCFDVDRIRVQDMVVPGLDNNVLLVILSTISSTCFGVFFQVRPRDLLKAGLGGMLSRIVLISFSLLVEHRLVYMSLAALTVSLYAEFMATRLKVPSTYFIYPSIIPLLPGSLFYYSIVSIYLADQTALGYYVTNWVFSLLGLSIGFVASSSIAYYVRKMRLGRLVPHRRKTP